MRRGYLHGQKLDFLILALFATAVLLDIPRAECLICGRNLKAPALQQPTASTVTTLHIGHHHQRYWQSNKHILFAKKSSIDAAPKEGNNDAEALLYNDDAFGLVFLSSVLVAHDPIFSSIFLSVSAIVAAITNVGAENKAQSARVVNLLPGMVALASFSIQAILLSPQNQNLHERLLQMLSEIGLDLGGAPLSTNALALEVGVCVMSIVWAFYRSTKSLADTTRM